ncbi:LysM peptidoglycan-binding domain-containing protein [Spirosoma validum]|uniref:LysM peptidoglycan-binding domain-containing protein n=1 Tax=Spirosoma validum TaxID=2771355 RepID=A0A927AZN5_9BACT|nr:LysM peptidoglycan-binding domain-containing protein [Spirosoma validum]MBD2752686.1 LysM peptidoglycan-binding domain-containing protein [Spirosoma validum]
MKTHSISFFFLLLIGLVYYQSAQAYTNAPTRIIPIDSIGVEKKNGKRFIIHRVSEGQTLYAIARRYGRSVAEIKAANPDMKATVQYNQLVRVPLPDASLNRKQEKVVDKAIQKQEKDEKREVKAKSEDRPVIAEAKADKNSDKDAKKADDPAKAGIHVVEAGQTLYSLASRYGVSQTDLRKWNNLPGNNVLIGQALIVSERAYQVRTPSTPGPAAKTSEPSPRTAVAHSSESRPTTPTTEPHVAEHRTPPAESKPERRTDDDATTRPRTEPDAPSKATATAPTSDNRPVANPKTADTEVEIESPRPGNDAPMPTHGRRISDSGVAEIIDGTDGSGKYMALHRTAPIGTLVQVRNEFNNQSLWVKVIGRLPNTGINDKILIKLSTQAFSKLSPQDRRFRAEVSYIVR